ncbi:hypothetical protein LAG90_15710 [Marinilongibacter aquaticus]|uniref:hypothetical protein n=1 Tax=Marinilongibacter aquaticus TaxID=2975157 RepID=UPI0021BDBA4B|nr:hypothetical protein [Marinilongibacter aquaticus]UBM58250.1 hypothetical protein LAG90_15710 [Marinilongibacter aquaticus]
MAVTNFTSLRVNSHQSSNPAGAKKVAIMLAAMFTAEWPVAADVVGGEITGDPADRLPVDQEWPVYEVPHKSIKFDDEKQGDPGYQNFKHMLSYEMAGFSKELAAEMDKHINAGVVYLVQTNDNKWAVIGTSQNPIFTTYQGTSGQAGTDKRGKIVTGEQDGYAWGILPLSDAVVAALTFEAFPA